MAPSSGAPEHRERWQNLTTLDPNDNLLVWSWTRHALQRARYEAAVVDPAWAHIDFIRLRTRARIDDLVAGHLGR
ncbi:MAG: hypothetical protein AAGF11_22080 [Myxococcota bacterium]